MGASAVSTGSIISRDQLAQLRSRGYFVIDDFFAEPEIAAFERDADRAVERARLSTPASPNPAASSS